MRRFSISHEPKFIEYFNPRTRKGCDQFSDGTEVNTVNFNPRTRKGCDTSKKFYICRLYYFNPRTRKGCDQKRKRSLTDEIISIHAPAKGATKWYNRRSYKERFQSTHPQRVRQLLRKNTAKIYYFNPRTRKGCDFEWVTAQFFNTYFNPRTRKGCDYFTSISLIFLNNFNPRTRKGCDILNLYSSNNHLNFNPRTRKGCDGC